MSFWLHNSQDRPTKKKSYFIADETRDVVLQMAVKKFSKLTSKNGEIGRFNQSLLTESF